MPETSRLKGSLIISFAQKYSELLITFASTVILSRLLTPEEVGIFSVVATILIIAHMFRDFGVSQYIVQESELTDEKLVSAFLVTLCCSYSIAILLFLVSNEIAHFFERNEIKNVINIILINFLIIPFGSVALSLLRKAMNFSALYKINVTSTFIGALVSIFLAYSGYSYMSLVWGSICGTSVTVIMASYYRKKVQICLPDRESLVNVVNFGVKVSYISIMLNSVNQLPELLIGKLFGMHSVGLYSRATGLVKIFHVGVMQGILPVLLPHLVSMIDQSRDIGKEYLKIIESICALAWPFFIFISILGEPIVTILYGDGWEPAAEFIYWIAGAAALSAIYAINADVFIALKKVDTSVRVQTVAQISSVLIMLVSSIFGLHSLLLGIVISKFVTVLVSTYYLSSVSGIRTFDVLGALKKPLILATSSAFVLIIIHEFYYLYFDSDLYFLAISSLSFTFVYLFVAALLKPQIFLYFLSTIRSPQFIKDNTP